MSVCAVDVRDALYKISFKNSYGTCTSFPLLLTGVKRVGFATTNGVAPRCPFAAATMMTTFSMHSELKMAYGLPLIPSSPSTPHTHTSHVCMCILYTVHVLIHTLTMHSLDTPSPHTPSPLPAYSQDSRHLPFSNSLTRRPPSSPTPPPPSLPSLHNPTAR